MKNYEGNSGNKACREQKVGLLQNSVPDQQAFHLLGSLLLITNLNGLLVSGPYEFGIAQYHTNS